MSVTTVVAASLPAEEPDVFNGEQPTFDEFSSYRKTGELPTRFKPAGTAASATVDAPEETVDETEGDEPETEPDPEPEVTQEPQHKGAEKRIKQLLADKKELQRKLDATAQTGVTPAPPAAQTATAPQPQATRPKPTAEDSKPDGTPKYATYEDFVEELADWKAEQRMATAERAQADKQALKALQVKLDDARTRYEDADDVIFPAAQKINDARIPQAVKEVFSDSDVFPDLCYVVGSDPEELKKFISLAQSNPRAALEKVFEYERGIKEELAKSGGTVVEPSGNKAPERKTTTAPKPPSPVSGASSRAFDVSDESLSSEVWAQKRNQQLAKRKG